MKHEEGPPFASQDDIRRAGEMCRMVTVGAVRLRLAWEDVMSHAGRMETVRMMHRLVTEALGRVTGTEIELAKATRAFGESDPLVVRLRERLQHEEQQVNLAMVAYENALNTQS